MVAALQAEAGAIQAEAGVGRVEANLAVSAVAEAMMVVIMAVAMTEATTTGRILAYGSDRTGVGTRGITLTLRIITHITTLTTIRTTHIHMGLRLTSLKST